MASLRPSLRLSSEDLTLLTSQLEYASDEELDKIIAALQEPETESSPSSKPHRRQQEFLDLNCEEALYGGAGGGGKTRALLLWLAQGVDIPGYTGLFLRRTYPQLTKSNDSPVAQSHEIYRELGGVYQSTEHRWTFPKTGARIEFGHLSHATAFFNYQGPAFHRVAFDELTQHVEDHYEYLFTRIRRREGFPITCGMRAASNPGGLGHTWVRQRFVSHAAMDAIERLDVREPSPAGMVFYTTPDRAFVPARVADNPSLDMDEYLSRLRRLKNPVLAAQIASGNWRVSEGTLIEQDWFRYYDFRLGGVLTPLTADGESAGYTVAENDLRTIVVIDTAGTSKDKAAEDRGRPASWSVAAVWSWYPRSNALFLREVWRERVAYPALKAGVQSILDKWKPNRVIIENAHFGPALASELRQRAEMIGPMLQGQKGTSGDGAKLERATAAGLFRAFEESRIYFPSPDTPGVQGWLPEYEAELLAWTGREGETADQIDVTSYTVAATDKPVSKGSWSPVNPRQSAGRVGLSAGQAGRVGLSPMTTRF